MLLSNVQPHGLQPARLLCPWTSPGKNTGVGCHSLLQDLPDPGIEPRSPALQADCLPLEPPGKLIPSYFLSWRQLPSVSVCLPLPPAFPAPPPLSLRVALCSLSGCSLKRCLYVLFHCSPVWWWEEGEVYMFILLGEDYLAWLCAHQMPGPPLDALQPPP